MLGGSGGATRGLPIRENQSGDDLVDERDRLSAGPETCTDATTRESCTSTSDAAIATAPAAAGSIEPATISSALSALARRTASATVGVVASLMNPVDRARRSTRDGSVPRFPSARAMREPSNSSSPSRTYDADASDALTWNGATAMTGSCSAARAVAKRHADADMAPIAMRIVAASPPIQRRQTASADSALACATRRVPRRLSEVGPTADGGKRRRGNGCRIWQEGPSVCRRRVASTRRRQLAELDQELGDFWCRRKVELALHSDLVPAPALQRTGAIAALGERRQRVRPWRRRSTDPDRPAECAKRFPPGDLRRRAPRARATRATERTRARDGLARWQPRTRNRDRRSDRSRRGTAHDTRSQRRRDGPARVRVGNRRRQTSSRRDRCASPHR